MAKQIILRMGTVREVEDINSYHRDLSSGENVGDGYSGLRIRVELDGDDVDTYAGYKDYTKLPWCFPLLPKMFQSIPKVGEAVIVFSSDSQNPTKSQRFYIGPIISQPQYNEFCTYKNGTSLLNNAEEKPLESIEKNPYTNGSFPKSSDVAVIGRGAEDIILRRGVDDSSEIDLRAGIRGKPTNDQDKNMVGNIIFNGTDPAYIQLKYKKGLVASENMEANSVINIVANRINLMSNRDNNINCNINDSNSLVQEGKLSEIMLTLQPIPLGYVLYDYLTLLKNCILHHVHPWAGMEQCGDWGGYIKELENFNLNDILSKYVRTS